MWRRTRRARSRRNYHRKTSLGRALPDAPALDGRLRSSAQLFVAVIYLSPPPSRPSPRLRPALSSRPSLPLLSTPSSSSTAMQVPIHPVVIGQPISPVYWPRKLPKPTHISVNVRPLRLRVSRSSRHLFRLPDGPPLRTRRARFPPPLPPQRLHSPPPPPARRPRCNAPCRVSSVSRSSSRTSSPSGHNGPRQWRMSATRSFWLGANLTPQCMHSGV